MTQQQQGNGKKHGRGRGNKIITLLALLATFLSFLTYYTITRESSLLGFGLSRIIWLTLSDLVVFLALGILLARKVFKRSTGLLKAHGASKLQNRIIFTFSLVVAIPTITISIFSTYFFNFGLQSWFDQRISNVLDQSVIVAESYIEEHTIQLKETAVSVADDLSDMYHDLIHDQEKFVKTLNSEAEMRSLSDVIVFQRSTNTVLAKTSLSFALAVTTIPMYAFERADSGEMVQINSDPTKIRMLTKLREYEDTYLIIGRLVDSKVIDHIDKTNGAVAEYQVLKQQISNMQITFSIIFIVVALLLLLVAISWGAIFAGQIVSPIKNLVLATEQVKAGDLTVQVQEDGLDKDELRLLTSAFNSMIKRIGRQQKDLMAAQRALAWSDVARRVAHEVKNPLTPIQLSAERLLRKFGNASSDPESFQKYVETIIRHTNDIKTIISEFVDFAKLPTPVFVECDIVSTVKTSVDSRRLINDKIVYKFTSNKPLINFIGDTTQLNQIMTNLLKNAEEALEHKVTEVGQSKFKPYISVDIKEVGQIVTVTIIDNGPGFPLDLLSKATEAYITSRSNGTGLGLAIVKKITQDHFGTIDIANNIDQGAAITLTFDISELKFKLK